MTQRDRRKPGGGGWKKEGRKDQAGRGNFDSELVLFEEKREEKGTREFLWGDSKKKRSTKAGSGIKGAGDKKQREEAR